MVLIISGLKMKCDTCDSKNVKSPVSVRVRARVSGEDYCFYNSKYHLVRRFIGVARICQLMIQSVPQKTTRRFMKSEPSFCEK